MTNAEHDRISGFFSRTTLFLFNKTMNVSIYYHQTTSTAAEMLAIDGVRIRVNGKFKPI